MRLLHRLVGALLFIVLAVGSALCLRAACIADEWAVLRERAATLGRAEGFGLGLAMLSLVALFALTGVPRRRRRKLLSFDNEGGTVSISTDAICDYIIKLGSEFPSILRLVPEVVTGRNAIDLIIGVRVKAGPQIHEICELLQQRVRESMTSGLGITQVRRVEVSVTDIVSEHKPQ